MVSFMRDYNLLFTCKKTKKKYEGKRVTNYWYRIKQIGTFSFMSEEISAESLRKNFISDKNKNRGNGLKNNEMIFNKRIA